ncbi:MAG: beta-glucoside-specific PTS transporter subunit IIABC [Erysipelotrichaceae bacterium]|nr:beta-glucoside-specific PTS transporter subunit IIABC [Erysipelotrichaceae bacterium]
MNYQDLANQIVHFIGGKENVQKLTHCATRLRFHLKDEQKANTEELEKLSGVLGVVQNAGQYQIIIGNNVQQVYKPIMDICQLQDQVEEKGDTKKMSITMKFVDTLTSIFTPILPAITAAGMIKAILALLTAFQVLDKTTQSYQIMEFIADSAFYFLPILLANSAAKKFGCNAYLAMMIGGVLLHPTFIQMVANAKESGEVISLFQLPIYNATYSSSVIPIILAVWFLSYVEPLADKVSPNAIKFFTKPLITIAIASVVTLMIIGPFGFILSNWIGAGITALNTYCSWLVPMILGATFPLLVMTGTHYGIVPIGINNRLSMGYDTFVYAPNLCSNIAQGGATLAVALKSKNKEIKQLASSSGLTAVCGITEPALYGINLKYKKPLIAACIGGGFGGLFVGLFGVRNYAGGSPGLLTLPSYLGERGFQDLLFACIGAAISFIIAFILSYILYKENVPAPTSTTQDKPATKHEEKNSVLSVYAPVKGQLLPLSDVKDQTFAQEIMGKGVAIIPEEDTFVSPVTGEVKMVFDTKHAIGLLSDQGVEILIHIGLDTVQLGGKHFQTLVKTGDKIKQGTPILKVDRQAIQQEGYDITTPIIITNTKEFHDIISIDKGSIQSSASLLKILR